LEVFKKAFEKVYVACNVEKIELYKNALDANKPNESSAQVNTEQNIQTEVNF